jgi:nucleoside-diphosphate-sugar epimerase
VTKGEQLRDFIYIEDVVSAYLTILKKIKKLQNFNEFDVGTGTLTSIRTFVETLKTVYDDSHLQSDSQFIFGAIPYREGEMMSVQVDNSALLQLGWHPIFDLNTGLRKIIELEYCK